MPERVAIVTAATKGMGKAISEKLHAEGYELGILARGEEVFVLAKELKAVPVQGSVDNAEDLECVIRKTREEFGKIDVVVNNTGHAAKGELLNLTDKEWHEGIDLLLMNVIRMSRLITPVFERQGNGVIVNISTFAAKEPSLAFPVSSIARSALSSFCKLYSERYGPKGIRMNNILPGYIDSYSVDQEVLHSIPMRRQGTTGEVADLVAFLASEKASYITGQNIPVDGGFIRSV